MSRIWDYLKLVEQHQLLRPTSRITLQESVSPERRSGERRRICLPIFVYGHSADREPFYESTEVLYANDSGGLITLQAAVTAGEKLLLTIKSNSEDQECRIIGVRSAYLTRFAIAIAFGKPLRGFSTSM
ncbi:MAG: hypothetical protein WBQ34_08330 [Candidatus Acidiferrales bacterium]